MFRGPNETRQEKIKTEDGSSEGKRVPVVLQYRFDFLNDKAKAIVETHATEAAKRGTCK